jgi:hypothetical protein
MEDLPTYTETDDTLRHIIQELTVSSSGLDLPIASYPSQRDKNEYDEYIITLRQQIVEAFFSAIKTKKDEMVAMLIENKLTTTSTTDQNGQTPLLAAVEAENIRMVQELMDFGADINAYGMVNSSADGQARHIPSRTERTPLQLAASLGNLALVKLLMETYGADDALVAPDGQLALRLANKNGHREVVDYLPLRRGGGWRRWKVQHAKAVRRAKEATRKLWWLGKALVWDIPKFFVWTIPKEMTVYVVKNYAKIGAWCLRKLREIPDRVMRLISWMKDLVKEIPAAAKTLALALKKQLLELPKRIANALSSLTKWVWNSVCGIAQSVHAALSEVLSLLHTIIYSIATFFRDTTLQDIVNGAKNLLRIIFLELPKKVWSWILKLGDMSYDLLYSTFDVIGSCIWYTCCALLALIIYVPQKIGIIVVSIGGSILKAWEEFLIWLNPKR